MREKKINISQISTQQKISLDLVIYLFVKYLLNAYCVPDPMPGIIYAEMSKKSSYP